MNSIKNNFPEPIIPDWEEMAIYHSPSLQLMRPFIKEYIDKLFIENDYDEYINSCMKNVALPEEISNFIEKNNIDVKILWDVKNPTSSEEWIFTYPTISIDNFVVNFNSEFRMSKVLPLFEINHSFAVENMSKNIAWPTLDGTASDPYSKDQFNFYIYLVNYLFSQDYYMTVYGASDDVIIVPDTFKLKEIDNLNDYATIGGLFYRNSLNIYKPLS